MERSGKEAHRSRGRELRRLPDARTLEEVDVRAVVRLLGDVAAVAGGRPAQVRRLMEGMTGLVGAEAWSWSLIVNPDPEVLPTWVIQVHGGFDDGRFARFMRAQEHVGMRELTAGFAEVLLREGRHLTALRQYADPDNRFPDSAAGKLWREADLMPGILSAVPLRPGVVRAITVHRRADAPLFSDRDARIAHILLTEVAWLHAEAEGGPQSGVAALSPRLRTALNLLLQGFARATVAEHLGVSPHTVNGYVKEIHRQFGVSSQAELMRKFFQSNGGDARPPPVQGTERRSA